MADEDDTSPWGHLLNKVGDFYTREVEYRARPRPSTLERMLNDHLNQGFRLDHVRQERGRNSIRAKFYFSRTKNRALDKRVRYQVYGKYRYGANLKAFNELAETHPEDAVSITRIELGPLLFFAFLMARDHRNH